MVTRAVLTVVPCLWARWGGHSPAPDVGVAMSTSRASGSRLVPFPWLRWHFP